MPELLSAQTSPEDELEDQITSCVTKSKSGLIRKLELAKTSLF